MGAISAVKIGTVIIKPPWPRPDTMRAKYHAPSRLDGATCSTTPTRKMPLNTITPYRRPSFSVTHHAYRHDTKSPSTCSDTVYELTAVDCALVYPKSLWNDSNVKIPPATPESYPDRNPIIIDISARWCTRRFPPIAMVRAPACQRQSACRPKPVVERASMTWCRPLLLVSQSPPPPPNAKKLYNSWKSRGMLSFLCRTAPFFNVCQVGDGAIPSFNGAGAAQRCVWMHAWV